MKKTYLAFLMVMLLAASNTYAGVSQRDTNVGVIDSGKALYAKDFNRNPVRIVEVDSAGDIEFDNGAAGASFSGALTVDGAMTLSGATGITSDVTFSSDANIVQNGMTVVRDVVTLADDANVTLNASVTGVLTVMVEGDDEYAVVHCQDDATVTATVTALGSVAYTDSDTNLSIYDGGTAVIIKNRLGSEKVIIYEHKYK